MRGRKPKLDNVRTLRGGAGIERDDYHLAQARAIRPVGLSRDERAVWDEVAVELSKLGRLHARFALALAEFVHLTCKIRRLRKDLDAEGWTYESTGRQGVQQKSRPQVAQLNDDWRKWRSLLAEFGLTPASERAIAGSIQGDLFDNPFADLSQTTSTQA